MTRVPTPGREARARRLAIEAARARLSTVVDDVQEQPVLLTRRGRPVAAVITMEQYELLVATEKLADRQQAREGERESASSPRAVAGGDEV